jgi:hypothetical protein
MFITPYNEYIKRDVYFEVTYENTPTAYVVSGFDINSTPGVAYVSVDPSYVRESSAEDIKSAANSWFSGGVK